MTSDKPLVIVTRRLPDVVETRMAELFDTRLNDDDHPLSPAELVAAMHEADVLVPTVTDRIDAGLLAQAGDRLRLIANYGNGVDNIFDDMTSSNVNGSLKKALGFNSAHLRLDTHTAAICSSVQPVSCW